MDLSNVPLFNIVKKRMAWLGQRQEVIAQNIANSDTPKYKARDIKEFRFKELIRKESSNIKMLTTNSDHRRGQEKRYSEFGVGDVKLPYETAPNGNSVVLEEQLSKMGESSINYRLTTELYKKHIGMRRSALGRS
jgi:flagellar basal-body rod protein FlgB